MITSLAAGSPLFLLRAIRVAAGGYLAAPQAVAKRQGRDPGITALREIIHVVVVGGGGDIPVGVHEVGDVEFKDSLTLQQAFLEPYSHISISAGRNEAIDFGRLVGSAQVGAPALTQRASKSVGQ